MNNNNPDNWEHVKNALHRRSEKLVHNVSPPSSDEREKIIHELKMRRSGKRSSIGKTSIGMKIAHLGSLIAAPRLIPAPALLAIVMLTSTVMISSNYTNRHERVFRGSEVSVYESSRPTEAATETMISLTKSGIDFEVSQESHRIDIHIIITPDNKKSVEKITGSEWSTDARVILRYLLSPQ